MTKILLSRADCDKVNACVPPTAGVPVGGGIHIDIPADWQARIAAGIPVPGCTYVLPDADGAVTIAPELTAKLQASPDPRAAQVLAVIAVAVPIPDPVLNAQVDAQAEIKP
jgi:hypothetical protein